MPVGRYVIMDGEGRPVGTEEFRCAPGPAGWRYFSQIETVLPEPHREVVDLAVDGSWRAVRLRIDTESHRLDLVAEGDRLVGRRDGRPLDLAFGADVELDYLSPCFNAVTANRRGRSAAFPVIYLEPFTCEPVLERQRYDDEGDEEVDTPVGRFAARRWQYTSLGAGWSATFWAAGDVVVAYQGLFALEEYEPGPRGPFPAQD
jgi:hypothetical protein